MAPASPASSPSPTAFEAQYYEPFDNLMKTTNEKFNSGSKGHSASFDDALAAYAQFICLRLRVGRCLVSCFDRNHQYILAEATPTLSLTTNKADDPKDELWMGSCIQERYTHLCERTLELADKKVGKVHDGVVVMSNIADNEWYEKHKSRISLPDGVRFYAGSAIRSPFGPVIGVITILDDKPRDTLSHEDQLFLQHMSDTIMSHLDMVRSKEEHRRTSQMVLGLGSFVEGKGHVDMNLHNKDLPKSNVIEHQGDRPLTPGSSAPKPPEMEDIEQNNPLLNPQDTNNASEALNFENLQAQMLSTDVKSCFKRAAGIIRNAIDVEGVVFLDASVGSFGALVQSVPITSEDDTTSYFTHSSSSQKECHVLASAGETDPNLSITEGFLHSFLTRYGQGRIFNIDPIETEVHTKSSLKPEESEDFGQKVEPMEKQHSDQESREKVRRQREIDIAHLKRLFPSARSMAFLPMWDDHRMRWFCGGFIWSNRAIRLLHKDSELSFLRAFGMAIMSEVAKLDTAMADKAKSDLLNSISHELRSPLHGILGSIECLESSALDPMQHGLVETVDTCGRTLLDTINHLLDFSKINNFTRNKTKRQKNSETRQADMLSLDSTVHLPTITEEALETVFAGYTSSVNSRDESSSSQRSKDSKHNRNVEVVVDIEAKDHENWLLCTEGGAWKRLVMNLTGNSLKYTTDGFIYVKLDSLELPRDNGGSKRSRITLTIKDTGRGISKEYLQNHLFRPFAQEDPLNPGAGLGLSMVRHIVSNLGGEISVESELDKGTEIRVEVIMMDPGPSPETNDEAFVMTEAARKLHGLRAVFIDPPNSSDGETPSQRSLRRALDKQCWGWFNIEFSTVSSVDEVEDAALVLTTCHTLPEIKEQLIRLGKPIAVLCESNTQLRQMYIENEALRGAVTTEFIAQPYGPRKLARAFVSCKEQQPRQLEDVVLYRDTELMTLPSMPVSDARKHGQEHDTKQPSDSHEHTPPRKAQKQSKVAEETKGPTEQENGSKSLRLLLVDDNKINLQLLVRYCKSKKHDYVTAEDGVEAVEAFTSHQQDAATKFDFVCMDISMPRMDGLEATRKIRSFEHSKSMVASKVIALTGLASAEAQQEAFSSGVDQFMTKPVRLKELGEVLAGRR
ncbi:hypothetical protein E4T52_14285 [Aureobasidium sp. EXF-3400]|nr:hypothetical protein E4T51_13306 [Aureobasidium sp. EXF-12344]KAI4770699.1 hypothetical protein E4T52_14285 [Aureobasidium sp. EXF-3400]